MSDHIHPMSGILNTLKPPGMTSHDVVAQIRRMFGVKRVGHAGTLDPAAAGVLPICVGSATKAVQFLQIGVKEYRAELILGYETDTQDYTGVVVSEAPEGISVSRDELVDSLSLFLGEILQTPPMASAVRVGGQRLYELARKGMTIQREPRIAHVESLRLVSAQDTLGKGHRVVLDVVCGKGTYVRTLCHDIGRHLGCGGHMGFLLRVRVGDMCIADSLTLDELQASLDDGQPAMGMLVSVADALSSMAEVQLMPGSVHKGENGVPLGLSDLIEPLPTPNDTEGFYRIMNGSRLIAVYQAVNGHEGFVLKSVRGF